MIKTANYCRCYCLMQSVADKLKAKLLKHTYHELPPFKLHATANDILDKTCHLFVEEGMINASMRKIAEVSGIKLASLQYHFKNSDALIAVLVGREVFYHGNMLSREFSSADNNPEAALKAAVKVCMPSTKIGDVESLIYPHIWALATHNESAKRGLGIMLSSYREVFAYLVAMVNPNLSMAHCNDRAMVITSAIEGSMLYLGLDAAPATAPKRLHTAYQDMAMSVALAEA
ncbi:MAG: AcrR family transcriptional regulator [Flavobacterium sp.]|jgi:AcrR family transcriptional regulator